MSTHPDFILALLAKRGITSESDVQQFLHPEYERDIHDPFLISGMDRAVTRVLTAITDKEHIAVYADFDCDGVPGASLLHDFFRAITYPHLSVYIPHRDREGYGFHTGAVDTLSQGNVSLIITVDVGITAHTTVAYAKQKGIDVIVTDHHEIIGTPPGAHTILHPHMGEYPFRHLCGTAVAFKLAHALLLKGRAAGLPEFMKLPFGWEKWLLDLVALATVADMVPLLGENRALVSFGLTVLRKTKRKGLQALFARTRLHQGELSEDDIGFTIGPRLNAASRMDSPMLAFRLLTTEDEGEAEHLAGELERLNTSRKGVVGVIVREANKKTDARFSKDDSVVVVGDPTWKPALLGLAANSVLGKRRGVVCLWGKDINGDFKGSCRSDGSVSIPELFTEAHTSLSAYGGHKAAGGFSVSHENIHALPEAFLQAAQKIKKYGVSSRERNHDLSLLLTECSWHLFQNISKLSPFGIGNPKPMVRISGAQVSSVRRFGKSKEHVEISFICTMSGEKMRGFQFFTAPEGFSMVPTVGTHTTILGTLERDSFHGPRSLAVRVSDMLAA
ncbi:MAG TPA: single-stranded-DNA-specific exonuclease RecJ [Candidatus Paceibacterota bacterium]